jgi:hypothetical protein
VQTNLVGLLVLLIATCPGWCTRLHAHEAGRHDRDLVGVATAADLPAGGAEAPRPVNDDNCACAGALPGFAAAAPAPDAPAPLPFDHPFAPAAGPLFGSVVGAAGMPSAPHAGLAGDPLAPALRAARLRC